jgi:hypothetical protein
MFFLADAGYANMAHISHDDIDPGWILDVPNGDHNCNSDIQTFNNSREVRNQK